MRNTWHWYVFIIKCADGSYYTEMTWNIEMRGDQHFSGLGSKYTTKHGFKKLAYFEEHENLYEARCREIQIKNWSRSKKEKLISGEWIKDWR